MWSGFNGVLKTWYVAALISIAAASACSERVVEVPVGVPVGGGNGGCPPPLEDCAGTCVDLAFDPSHCGQCGHPCPDEEVCSYGQCGPNCTGGTTQCGDLCVDLDLDTSHCGTCYHACAAAEVCSAGQCDFECLGGTTQCDGVCVDLNHDPANCGSCGKACKANAVCSAGKCDLECLAGTIECGGVCVDTQANPAHCGNCWNVCAPGELCSVGQCGPECLGGTTDCSGVCVDLSDDLTNCGSCGNLCGAGEVCSAGHCGLDCLGDTTNCGGVCVDTQTNLAHCGSCGNLCATGELCSAGQCSPDCVGGTTNCGGACVDTQVDPAHCGGCSNPCGANEVCAAGVCNGCTFSTTNCDNVCVDTSSDPSHCGTCFHLCAVDESCFSGQCVVCDSATMDCDGDGWLASDGDCCDKPGACGAQPELVNPGAIEVVGNGVDDNCNGLLDMFDTADTLPCDDGLVSDSIDPLDYVKALGICRQTTESAPLPDRSWGLIDAQLLRVDGSPVTEYDSHSIRTWFGSVLPSTVEGESLVVLSTGVGSDATQTDPGPNGGPSVPSTNFGSEVSIPQCSLQHCIDDWYSTPNPPLKDANKLPKAPACGSIQGGSIAYDSVMLYLRLRAPTNARAFSFNSYFLSSEFPGYVCSPYNDQLVALVETPGGVPQPIPNPIDMNLMTHNDGQQSWPVGINIAAGTSLFAVCDSQPDKPNCWNNDVDTTSCSMGPGQLGGTGFEESGGGACGHGGTFWLTSAGNTIPGDIVELRIAIWEAGDGVLDSTALIDGFQWLVNATMPGTF